MKLLSVLLRSLGGDDGAFLPDYRRTSCRRSPSLGVPEDRSWLSSSPLRPGAASPFAVLGLNGGRVRLNEARSTASGAPDMDLTTRLDPSPRGRDRNASGGVARRDLSRAAADANAASAAYAALAPTQSFGQLIRSATITSTGDVNVIRVHSLNYDHSTLTLQGGPNDVFIFNVLGQFSFHHSKIQLCGGLTADHVLFNFPQPGPNVDLESAAQEKP